MFSGIIEGVGRVQRAESRAGGRRLVVAVPEKLRGLEPGASVAVFGLGGIGAMLVLVFMGVL